MSSAAAQAVGAKPNRLAHETSPYLLQHALNPVDWYPWGDEAFARALADDKPILLSVGYATCHWCHVMERECFEDDGIAQQLAEGFIAIKVDREELPDVDQVYMRALQAMSGRGGWPMNLFLTPQRMPFFGGTYFPPTARPGATSFPEVLKAVGEAWRDRRGSIEQQARGLMSRLAGGAAIAPASAADGLQAGAVAQISARFDALNGGFGDAPKFPQTPLLGYLLTLASLGDEAARAMLRQTLHAMAAGGLYDQIGGGFARYSTDARWQVPHFEKMLYDNAQLARVYAGAFRLTGDARLRVVAEDTLQYLLREMHPAASPSAFSSAQDADAEGVEGQFHVWTLSEWEAVLGADAAAAARLYDVSAEGNWREPGHLDQPARNVLQRRDAAAVQATLGLDEAGFVAWERSVRERLRVARAGRVWPITDDKVLADWNGMALRALAEGGRLLGRDDLVRAATELAAFLLATMVRDGRVHHAWRNGSLRSESYLADQAQLGLGLVELHAATGEARWLAAASEITESLLLRFHAAGVGFFDSESEHLPMRARELHDGAVPSGTAAACELLLRLAGAAGRRDWHDIADAALQSHSGSMAASAMAVPSLLQARLLADQGADLAVPTDPDREGLWPVARSVFAPLVTLISGRPGSLPLLEGRMAGVAYLCRHGSCELPAHSSDELQERLAGAGMPALVP